MTPNKELILEKHCPSMSLLYLDDNGRAFRKRILAAMEDYTDKVLHADRNQGQAKISENAAIHIKSYCTREAKGEKLALALRRLVRSVIVHPDYTDKGEWGDYVSGANDALTEWTGEKKVKP